MSNFDSNIIKNPEIFEQNRLAAHSDHVCYKNELEKIKGKSSLRYDMNGLCNVLPETMAELKYFCCL